MADVTIHDDESPDGRPATDDEIAGLLTGAATASEVLSLLASLEAADGTSYLDIYNATRDE